MRQPRVASTLLWTSFSCLALFAACGADDDEDGDDFWGAAGESGGPGPTTGGRSSGGRTGVGQGGRTGGTPTGGTTPRASDEELAENCSGQNPVEGASCTQPQLFCPGEDGPCICTSAGRNQSGTWTCYADAATPSGSGGTVASGGAAPEPQAGSTAAPQGGVPGEPAGGATAEPAGGVPGEPAGGAIGESGATSAAAGQATSEGGTTGEATGGAPAEPQGGSVEEPTPQGGAPEEPEPSGGTSSGGSGGDTG